MKGLSQFSAGVIGFLAIIFGVGFLMGLPACLYNAFTGELPGIMNKLVMLGFSALIFAVGVILISFGAKALKASSAAGKEIAEDLEQERLAREHQKLVTATGARAAAIEAENNRIAATEKYICKSCGQLHLKTPAKIFGGLSLIERCGACGAINSLVKGDTPLGKKLQKDWDLS